MKLSKTMPKGEARPLGTPRPKKAKIKLVERSGQRDKHEVGDAKKPKPGRRERGTFQELAKAIMQPAENKHSATEEIALQPESSEVESSQTAITPQGGAKMQLTYKGLNKKGNAAIYSGLPAGTVRFALSNFPGKTAPDSIEVSGDFAPAKAPKAKLSKEERAALKASRPKPTEAERIAKAEANIAKRKAKLAAAQQELSM